MTVRRRAHAFLGRLIGTSARGAPCPPRAPAASAPSEGATLLVEKHESLTEGENGEVEWGFVSCLEALVAAEPHTE